MSIFFRVVLIGIGATALTDLWAIVRQRLLQVALPDFGLVGRWLGHMAHGQFRHEAIAASPAIQGEAALGWMAHYLTGIAFAALLVALAGPAWLERPTPGFALAVGLGTVAAPFLLMQPGMGVGIAAARTANPAAARVHSLVTHGVFGVGLYLAALVITFFNNFTGA